MRINLGTIEVTKDERAAVAFYYGDTDLASRDRMRDYIIRNGRESILDQMAVMEEQVHGDEFYPRKQVLNAKKYEGEEWRQNDTQRLHRNC